MLAGLCVQDYREVPGAGEILMPKKRLRADDLWKKAQKSWLKMVKAEQGYDVAAKAYREAVEKERRK